MPKRKRAPGDAWQDKLEKHLTEIFRALRTAKGFERQRYSKRSRDGSNSAEKKERIEREIEVLKSIDLHQAARAHLYSSLLKVKSIAASSDVPDEIRAGVPKLDLPLEQMAAVHNVTSSLCKQSSVREAVERAVKDVCHTLQLPAPGDAIAKAAKRSKRDTQPQELSGYEPEELEPNKTQQAEPPDAASAEDEEVTDFEGFGTDGDEGGSPVGGAETKHLDGNEEFAEYNDLLGSSSDSEEEFDVEKYRAFRGKEQVNLEDISISGSAGEEEEEEEEEDDDDEGEAISSGSEADINTDDPELADTNSTTPPTSKNSRKGLAAAGKIRAGESAFLPTLMGGYISGSESEASEVDVAPPKKRLGQQQRQAIWEKKFGAQAKHLQQVQGRGKAKKGRDSGWDSKRGAVDGNEGRTPWRKGASNPFMRRGGGAVGGREDQQKPHENVERKKDDQGSLHPSWEAKKAAKASEKKAEYAGSKIVFE